MSIGNRLKFQGTCFESRLLRGFYSCTRCQGNAAARMTSSSLLSLPRCAPEWLSSSSRVRSLQVQVSRKASTRFFLSSCSKSYLCTSAWWYSFPKNVSSLLSSASFRFLLRVRTELLTSLGTLYKKVDLFLTGKFLTRVPYSLMAYPA